jgi:hypothetical protein
MEFNLKSIEDKILELTNEFNIKSDNLTKLISDIGKYSQAKTVMENDLHAINGALLAYKNTVELFKGQSTQSEPQTVDGTVTKSG